MRWPKVTSLVAVDRSSAMLDAVFPRDRGAAVVADWRALPYPAASFDWVIGDGCTCTLAFPDDYRALSRELGRVLVPDGELVLRLFAAPEVAESLDAITADLAAGRIGNFHVLKWRIAMAIQSPARAVPVTAIRDAFDRLAPDRAALAAATGWSMATIATIDAYAGSDAHYSFPTRVEALAALVGFEEVACETPPYELGDRCPTIVLRPTLRAA